MRMFTSFFLLFFIILAGSTVLFPIEDTAFESDAILTPPHAMHWFGTDDLGGDIFEQLRNGACHTLLLSFSVALFGTSIGLCVGSIAAMRGGLVDRIVQGSIDFTLSLPRLPIYLIVGAFFSTSFSTLVILFSMFSWAHLARLIRTQTKALVIRSSFQYAVATGGSFFHLFLQHIWPFLSPFITVQFVRIGSHAVIAEASLAFLGLSDPLSHSWGVILNRALQYPGIFYTPYWTWWVLFPLMTFLIFTLSLALFSRTFERKEERRAYTK